MCRLAICQASAAKIDITDFVSHKTAVFGMTRKGKSNTNKVLATMTAQHARERDLKIGQLIFDPAGEYGNDIQQDKTSLAALGADHVIRYRLGATDDELAAGPALRQLALNFFDERSIDVVWGVVGHFLRARYPGTQYVDAFTNANVVGPENTQTNEDYRQANHARRARLLAYGCFLKAGLIPPGNFRYWAPLNKKLVVALVSGESARGKDIFFLDAVPKGKTGAVQLDRHQIQAVCDALAANASDSAVQEWMDTGDERLDHLMDVYAGRKGGGHKILIPLGAGFHASSASSDYALTIYSDITDGKIVIVDLARGSEGILQFASERILNYLLAQELDTLFRRSEVQQQTMLDLLLEVEGARESPPPVGMLVMARCPECGSTIDGSLLRDGTRAPLLHVGKAGAICPACSRQVMAIDALRVHEAFDPHARTPRPAAGPYP